MSVPDPYRQSPAPPGVPPTQSPSPGPYVPPTYAHPLPGGQDYQQQAFQSPVPQGGRAATPVPLAASRPVAATPIPLPLGQGARPIPVKQPQKVLHVEEHAEDPDGADLPVIAFKKAPPWLISLVIHMVFLILLGLLVIVPPLDNTVDLEVAWAERIGEQLLDSSVLESSLEPVETLDKSFAEDFKIVEDPLAAPPEMQIDPLVAGTTVVSDMIAPTIGMALTGREKGAKQALLAAYGGTKLTEEAVRSGLLWLKKNQRSDGSWSLMGPYSDASTQENATAATAMALLAFQGAGNTHREGEFKDVVAKGWKWLLAKQDADGNFVQENVYNARLYTQAQCTIAICELYGMTKDAQYRKPAQLAIDYAIESQDPSGGGWRYTPRQDSDLSVTGWFVMALQSAMMSGLEVPSPSLELVEKFLTAAQHGEGAQYSYKVGQGPTLPMTAEGLLCRQYLGWKHADERLQTGVELLLENKLDYDDQNVYYWYYASQVLHHMGGTQWDDWNAVMREAVPQAQTQTGKEAGSWAPSNDRWGAHGGRLYVTCLSIYMLEVYYRHLPIYKHQLQ